MLPFLNLSAVRSPDLRLFASPWMPAWLCLSQSLRSGSGKKGGKLERSHKRALFIRSKLTKGQHFVSNARFIEIEILNTQMKWKDKRQLGFCDEFIYEERHCRALATINHSIQQQERGEDENRE